MGKRRAFFVGWTVAVSAVVWNCTSPKSTPGGACKVTVDCTAGYECLNGVCAHPETSDAQACTVIQDCPNGYACLSNKCTIPVPPDLDAGPADSGADAGPPICAPTVDALPAHTIACPLGGGTETCAILASSGNACCVADGVGDCNSVASLCDASAPSAAVWACAKGTDCNVDNTYCCLTAGAIDPTDCPPRATASASTCSHTACAAGTQTLCASNSDCIAVSVRPVVAFRDPLRVGLS